MKKKIILTRRWTDDVEHALSQQFDCEINTADTPFTADQLRDALQRADAVLTTVTDRVDASVLSVEGSRASIIANFGVGYSHIDIDVAKTNKFVVTNTPDVLSDCTADIAITLLLMVARRAGEGERELRASDWAGWRPTHMMGSKVTGKTLGIIGFGRIGQAMARRAHGGFDMNIRVYNRSAVAPQLLSACNAVQVGCIEDLLGESDFVSLHCPGGAENTHLINAERLAAMKSGAYLINTARGEVVDEEALIAALQQNKIAGAGLDVFQNEPELNPLFTTLNNTVLLPHLGSATVETRDAMGFRVAANLEQFFAGSEPADRVV